MHRTPPWTLTRTLLCLAALALATAALASVARAEKAGAPGSSPVVFRFAVSGDSRDCGDIVMPAIASKVLARKASFFWHLGDFRSIVDFDADMQHEPEHRSEPMSILQYENSAWNDFIDNQVAPFGSLPVYLAIGNHETIQPKTRDEYLIQFADWLVTPTLRQQRLSDDPRDHRLHAYYHWIRDGVDFICLDNGPRDQFTKPQLEWLERVLKRDESDPAIKTVVVGMHSALPDSLAGSHSMSQYPLGLETGRQLYQRLLRLRDRGGKRVYLLASHSHYYMAGIFNTEYCRTHGGVLPGWIVGTAGASRYALPESSREATEALTRVYGHLLASVHADGQIDFQFERVEEGDVPAAVVKRFTPQFVHWAFTENVGRAGTRHGQLGRTSASTRLSAEEASPGARLPGVGLAGERAAR